MSWSSVLTLAAVASGSVVSPISSTMAMPYQRTFQDIWEAVFGPVCDDGFPCRLYDKLTGTINASVAAYWQAHSDLRNIMERDWAVLGPKLTGKVEKYPLYLFTSLQR